MPTSCARASWGRTVVHLIIGRVVRLNTPMVVRMSCWCAAALLTFASAAEAAPKTGKAELENPLSRLNLTSAKSADVLCGGLAADRSKNDVRLLDGAPLDTVLVNSDGKLQRMNCVPKSEPEYKTRVAVTPNQPVPRATPTSPALNRSPTTAASTVHVGTGRTGRVGQRASLPGRTGPVAGQRGARFDRFDGSVRSAGPSTVVFTAGGNSSGGSVTVTGSGTPPFGRTLGAPRIGVRRGGGSCSRR